MSMESLTDLLVDQLKDLYSAENQLVKALPKMAKAASSDELRQGFETHLEETQNQVKRLDQIAEIREHDGANIYLTAKPKRTYGCTAKRGNRAQSTRKSSSV